MRFYPTVCRLTRGFLDGALKGQMSVLEALRGRMAVPGVDGELISVRVVEGR